MMQLGRALQDAIQGKYPTAMQEMCGSSGLPAASSASRAEIRSFGDYLSLWLNQSSSSAQNMLSQIKDTFGKIFTRREIYNFTGLEVCRALKRATYLGCSGTEGQFLSDRLEPWIGLARPISHNLETRVYYWPEIEI